EAIAEISTVRDLLRATIDAAERHADAPEGRADAPEGRTTSLDRPEKLLSDEQRRWIEPSGVVVHSLGTVVYAANVMLMRRLFGATADGLDRVPPNGHVIFAPNHRSLLDPFVIGAVLPLARLRHTFWGGSTDW